MYSIYVICWSRFGGKIAIRCRLALSSLHSDFYCSAYTILPLFILEWRICSWNFDFSCIIHSRILCNKLKLLNNCFSSLIYASYEQLFSELHQSSYKLKFFVRGVHLQFWPINPAKFFANQLIQAEMPNQTQFQFYLYGGGTSKITVVLVQRIRIKDEEEPWYHIPHTYQAVSYTHLTLPTIYSV